MHKFENGFVERTCAVVVEGNKATVQYQIGLNEFTIRELMAEWAKTKKPEGFKNALPENEKSKTEVTPKTNSESKSQVGPAAQTEPSDSVNSKAQKQELPVKAPNSPKGNPASRSKDSNEAPTSRTQTKPGSTEDTSETEDEPISKEALDEFLVVAGTEIAKRFKIKCDEKSIPIKSVSAEKAPRHPYVLLIKFKFELPANDSVQLEIADENFRNQKGAIRYALKGSKDTMLLNSNVAPIVIRAKRVELGGLSAKEVADQTSISAKLAIMSNSK